MCHVFVHEAYPNCFFLFSFQSAIHDAEEKRNFKIFQASEEFNFSFRFQLLSEEESLRCPVSGVTSGPLFASLPAAYATGPRPRKSADDVERTWVLGGGRGAEHKLMCRPGPTAQHK